MIDANLGLVDPDSGNVSGATVNITGNFVRWRRVGLRQSTWHHRFVQCGNRSTDTHRFVLASQLPDRLAVDHILQSKCGNEHGHTHDFVHRHRRALASPVAIRQIQLQSAASLVGKRLFYNNSKFDGNDAAAGAADDAAIATDKGRCCPAARPRSPTTPATAAASTASCSTSPACPDCPRPADFNSGSATTTRPAAGPLAQPRRITVREALALAGRAGSRWCGPTARSKISGCRSRSTPGKYGPVNAGGVLLWQCRRRVPAI